MTREGSLEGIMAIDRIARLGWVAWVSIFSKANGGCLEQIEIIIIDSVQPGNHPLLDQKEEEWIHRLRTMYHMEQGG